MSYIEVQFKGNRRAAFTNPMGFPIKLEDFVIVDTDKGEDLGRVVRMSDEDRLSQDDECGYVFPILRLASAHDFQRRQRNAEREDRAEEIGHQLVYEHRLPMKIVNVEYQLDGKKVTLYFTAEGRVDFRRLVKDLARDLRTRIDLRQIGARDEARKFGGFGPCGQQQCCSAWLARFEPVTTSMAKEQRLPLNPSKLSGNCGRLKCCLRFELEFYREELKKYPSTTKAVKTLKGSAWINKLDIFNEEVLIQFQDGDMETISLADLNELMDFEKGENHCESGCNHGPSLTADKKDESILVASAEPVTEPNTEPIAELDTELGDDSSEDSPDPASEDAPDPATNPSKEI
jgi:cell fate regulator YaaT (PSP1 superfamily)